MNETSHKFDAARITSMIASMKAKTSPEKDGSVIADSIKEKIMKRIGRAKDTK